MKPAILKHKPQISRWLWSSFYFAATFVLLHYTSHFWSTFNAWHLGFEPHFSYNGMQSLAHTSGWSVKRVAFVYLAPPLWGIFSAALRLFLFSKTNTLRTHLKNLFFWLSFNGFLLYFSYLATGLLSGAEHTSEFFTAFVGFYTWLEWKNSTIMGIMAVQAIVALAVALVFPPLILKLNHSRRTLAKPYGKWRVLLNVFLVPMALGSSLVLALTYPMSLNYQIVRILCCLPIIGVAVLAFNYVQYRRLTIVKGGLNARPYWQLAIAAGLLTVLCKFFFSMQITTFFS